MFLSVAENIFLGREPTLRRRGLKLIDWARMHEEAQGLLEMLGSRQYMLERKVLGPRSIA